MQNCTNLCINVLHTFMHKVATQQPTDSALVTAYEHIVTQVTNITDVRC